MSRYATGFLLLCALSSAAYAQAEGNEHTHVVLPTAKIEGGTGKSEIAVNLDIATGLDTTTDLRIKPSFHASAADGVTTLLSGDSNGFSSGGAWQLGVTASYIGLKSLKDRAFDLPLETRLSLVTKCKAACDADSKEAFCDAYKKEKDRDTKTIAAEYDQPLADAKVALDKATKAKADAEKAVADATTAEARKFAESVVKSSDVEILREKGQVDEIQKKIDAATKQVDDKVIAYMAEATPPSAMCMQAQPTYETSSKSMRDASLQLPAYMISAGFLIGETRHKFLDVVDATSMLYKLNSGISRTKFSFGMTLLATAHDQPITLELPVRIDSGSDSSKKTAKWCVPAGNVQQPDGSMAPAQSCDEEPLGKPTVSRTLSAAMYVGVVDRSSLGWRAAVGPVVKYSWVSNADNAYQFGFETPFYLQMSIIKDSLSGVLRLTPSLGVTHASDGTEETTFLLSLAILADRSMFADALQ